MIFTKLKLSTGRLLSYLNFLSLAVFTAWITLNLAEFSTGHYDF